jgi:hypothetical protein
MSNHSLISDEYSIHPRPVRRAANAADTTTAAASGREEPSVTPERRHRLDYGRRLRSPAEHLVRNIMATLDEQTVVASETDAVQVLV